MIANLEALHALARHGTMARAALDLRVTQSAVSKRVAALEASTKTRLVERQGRHVRLTSAGDELLRRTEPLLAQLRDAMAARETTAAGRLVVGMSESILASWGADVLAAVRRKAPEVEVVVNAHRSPVAIDHVRSGEHVMAIVAGPGERVPDVVVEPLLEEEMVIVPSRLRAKDLEGRTEHDVLGIEPGSATGRALARRLPALRRDGGPEVRVVAVVQSFASLVQMARAGLGHALVPIGIARSMGVPARALVRFPAPGVGRPVSLVGRKTSLARPTASAFRAALREALPKGDGYSPLGRTTTDSWSERTGPRGADHIGSPSRDQDGSARNSA